MPADTPAAVAPERLNFPTKLAYGFGSIAFGAKAGLLGLLLLYYNQVVGMPAYLVSLALAISVVWDAIWDPMIGQFSDNLRTPWGRRHPLMYAAAIPGAIGCIMLWHPPSGWSDWALFGYLLGCILLVRMVTSLYEVPSAALAPELAPDYNDRTVVLSYRWLFGSFGGILASVLAYGWFLRKTPDYPMGQLNPHGYGPLSIAVAAIMVVSILVSAAGTHHRIASLHKPAIRPMPFMQTAREVIATLKNWNFGVAVVAGISAGLGSGLSSGLLLYLATYFWELPSSSLLIVTVFAALAGPVAAVIGPILAKRFGKKQACMTLFFASVAVGNAPLLLRLLGYFPPNGDPIVLPTLITALVAATILGTGGFIIVSSMIADIVEESQTKTGRRSEGLLFSADSVISKVISGFSSLFPGLLLTLVAFPRHAVPGQVDPAILNHLAWVYLPITAGFSIISIATWSFYRIDKAAHERNLATIAEAAAIGEIAREAEA